MAKKTISSPFIGDEEYTQRFFALKELELTGMCFTPLFYDDEEAKRCLLCNCDMMMLENYYLEEANIKDKILLVLPTEWESKVSRTGNDYKKLHVLDEYKNNHIYITNYAYNMYKNYINMYQPLMVRVNISNGNSTLNYCKHANEIQEVILQNICFDVKGTNWKIKERTEEILKSFANCVSGDTSIYINNRELKHKIYLNYGLLKILRQEDIEFTLNKY